MLQSDSLPASRTTFDAEDLREQAQNDGGEKTFNTLRVDVSRREHDSGEKTDGNGRATYRVQPGRNFIWTERRVKVSGDTDPRYESLAVATNLVFVAN